MVWTRKIFWPWSVKCHQKWNVFSDRRTNRLTCFLDKLIRTSSRNILIIIKMKKNMDRILVYGSSLASFVKITMATSSDLVTWAAIQAHDKLTGSRLPICNLKIIHILTAGHTLFYCNCLLILYTCVYTFAEYKKQQFQWPWTGASYRDQSQTESLHTW